MSGHRAIGPGKAVDMSGLQGIGRQCVEDIIGCLIGGSSIGGHAGRTGISSPGTGSVSIGIAVTDTLTALGSPPRPSFPASTGHRDSQQRYVPGGADHAMPNRCVGDNVLYWCCAFPGENTNIMTGAHHA